MNKRIYILSNDFIKRVSHMIAGSITASEYDIFINFLQTEISQGYFTYKSESNLLRIIQSVYNPVTFIKDCSKYPVYIFYLIKISNNSNYLTDIIASNPGLIYLFGSTNFLGTGLDEANFSTFVKESLLPYKNFSAKVNKLKLIKKNEFLRIALGDQTKLADLNETTFRLSLTAKTILSELFDLCFLETLKKNRLRKPPIQYCVISLGKLGGNELNYSSDVDIMVFFDVISKNSKTNFEIILAETIKLFIEASSKHNENGFLYRIDLRLRPYGRSSNLCGHINDYLNYYEAKGENWERQMLIKMNFLGGSYNLYEKFSDYLQPFIYPRSVASSPLQQIAKMKQSIEKHNDNEFDIKNSPGGIRDVEFTVQALQLLNGGYIQNVRCSNTLKSIELLLQNKLLSKDEAFSLSSAYIFFREIEHFLQLMNNSQTHTIPEKGEIFSKLIHYFGYSNASFFIKKVNSFKKNVKDIFNDVTGQDKKDSYETLIDKVNFKYPVKFLKELEYLEKGTGLLGNKQFDSEMINSFQIIKPAFLKYLLTSPRPDITVNNFTRIIRNSKLPSIWYKVFVDTNFLNSVLTLCTYSQFAIDLFAEDKDLRDFLFTKKVFEQADELITPNMSTKKVLFILAVQLTLKILRPEKLSLYLSAFIFQRITSTVLSNLVESESKNFVVAALGSLGNKEITFFSDLDLLFVCKSNFYEKSQPFFTETLRLLKKELYPFNIDCRLRPEGKNSPLVWEEQEYVKYLKTRAVTWEFQTLCKLSYICGDKIIFDNLKLTSAKRIEMFGPDFLYTDITKMRQIIRSSNPLNKTDINLKHHAGGIMDIDFFTQYLVLSNNKFNSYAGLPHFAILTKFAKKNNVKIFELLARNYLSLKYINLYFQNIYNKKCKLDNEELLTPKLLKKYIKINVMDFYNELEKTLLSNYEFLNEIKNKL